MMRKKYAVVGLGKTGVASVRYLLEQDKDVFIVEENPNNPHLHDWDECPQVKVFQRELQREELKEVDAVVVSPGVPLTKFMFDECRSLNIPMMGDIDLFATTFPGKIIAVTGSNGKSTVTALLGEVLKAAGKETVVAGNIGVPVLEVLPTHAEYAVLELSSYQLELTQCLSPEIATILNITPDHLDRYVNFEAYANAKHRIFQRARCALVNKEDGHTIPKEEGLKYIVWTSQTPEENEYGLLRKNNETFLAKGNSPLMSVKALKITGEHNWQNALAAFAMADALGIPWKAIEKGLSSFPGLPHRCQWVRTLKEVNYINDSKGTNVGATLAALDGLGRNLEGRILLLAGGQGKQADFSLLRDMVKQYCREVFLFGEDAGLLADALKNTVPLHHVRDLKNAVEEAAQCAEPKDVVLLSPACASFDMFENFMHRGDYFSQCVMELPS